MKPTLIRTKMMGVSMATGAATMAKSVAVQPGIRNIASVTASIIALNRITARDFTLSE